MAQSIPEPRLQRREQQERERHVPAQADVLQQLRDPSWSIAELRHLNFRRCLPHRLLQDSVQCYWYIRPAHLQTAVSEALYPDGGIGLTFNLRASSPDSAISLYYWHQYREIQLDAGVDAFGIHFHPGGASRLLGLSFAELTPGSHNALAFDIPDLQHLYETLLSSSPEQRPQATDLWLLTQLGNTQCSTNNLVSHALMLLQHSQLSMDKLSAQVGTSRRSLERHFRHRVGLSPHSLQQLWQLRLARLSIKQHPHRPLTDIAHDCGFYDQSHFIRHFRKFTHLSPGQYRERQLARLAKGEMRILSACS